MAANAADCNLLFGILALQNNFITRAQLLAAFDAWVGAKDRALGQILVEQKAVDAETHALLSGLVGKHLQMHNNDPEQSLAAVPVSPWVQQQIQLLRHPDLQASIGHLAYLSPPQGRRTGSEAADPEATRSGAVGESSSAGSRFRILRPHAEGGLGKVSVALDGEFNREVALKEIKERHADDASSRTRFLLEAEITGGLEHPGIVPVYGLGTYADGRPFYAMRFIRGDSLKDAIARFHANVRSTGFSRHSDDADRLKPVLRTAAADFTSLEFRQLLGRFVDVCNAIAYAHSRGILHRDLKPGNIMLGKFGETLVVDWGLAKAVGSRQTADGSQSHDEPASPHHPLTPSAPHDSNDEPPLQPFSGDNVETLAGTAVGTPAFMSPEQAAGRLDMLGPASDVYSLGATLYQILTGQPALANEKDLPTAELLRRVQKGEIPSPRQLCGTGVPPALNAVCMKAMALRPGDRYATPRMLADDIEHWLADEPVSAWPEPAAVKLRRWARHHQTLVTSSAASLFIALIALTAGLLWYQDEQNRRANQRLLAEETIRNALDQAEKPHRDLNAILAKRGGVFGLLNEPARWEAYIQTARNSLKAAQDMLASAEGGAEPGLAERAADLQELLERDEADRVLAEKLEKIRLDRSTVVDNKFDLRGSAARYPVAFAKANIVTWSDPPAAVAARLAAAPIKEQLLAALDDWAFVGFVLGKQGLPEKLLEIGRLAAPDPAWGDRLRRIESWRDQTALTKLARDAPAAGLSAPQLDLMDSLLADDNPVKIPWLRQAQAQYPADFWLNLNLGNALRKSDPAEAAGFHRVALGVRPRSGAAYNNLGNALFDQKKLPEAIAAFHKAIEIDPNDAFAYNNLGAALDDRNKLPEAIAAFHKAVEIDPKFAPAYNNLGKALFDRNKLPEAIAAFHNAIEIDPNFATAYSNLGNALYHQKKLSEAIAACRKAIEIDPKEAMAYNNLGLVFDDQKMFPEAIAAFHNAIKIDPKCAKAYLNLGSVLYDQKKLPEAIAAFRKAIEIDPKYAKAYTNLGGALKDQKKLPEAIAAYHKAIEIDPKSATVYTNLGNTLCDQKKLSEAIAAYRQAIEIDPKFVFAHSGLGFALFLDGRFADGAAAMQKAVDLLPPNAPFRASCVSRLKQCQQLQALADRVLAAVGGTDSATPGELLQMAEICHQFQKRFGVAVLLYRKAFTAQPALADDMVKQHRYNAACAAALAATSKDAKDRPGLRRQARDWLQGDLDVYAKQVNDGKPALFLQAELRLVHWFADPDLAGMRDAKALAALPEAERSACTKLWADAAQLHKQIRGRITTTVFQGTLTDKAPQQVHEMKLDANKTYVIDMRSTELDSYLKLHDPTGKLVAENDDFAPDNLDARIIFAPQETGVYRIVVTSFQAAGRGDYELIVRQFAANAK